MPSNGEGMERRAGDKGKANTWLSVSSSAPDEIVLASKRGAREKRDVDRRDFRGAFAVFCDPWTI